MSRYTTEKPPKRSLNLPALVIRTANRLAWRTLHGSGALEDLQHKLMHAFARSLSSDYPQTTDQMRSNVSWLFATNRQIGGRGGRLKPNLFLNSRDGHRQPKKDQVYDHPFLDLVNHPNSDESGMVFQWRQLLQLNTIGRCYPVVVPEVIDLSSLGIDATISRIREMRLLPPDRVRPMVSDDPKKFIAGYEFRNEVTGAREVYPPAPWDRAEREVWKQNPYPYVFQIVMPAPDSMTGQSVSHAMDSAARINAGLSKLHENQLVNGLHAGLVFMLLRDIEDPDRFAKAVLLVKQGLGKAGEPLVLPKKLVEIAKNPLTNKEMEFPGLSTQSRREILAVAGGSEGLIGLVEDVNRSNIEGLERIMAIGTIDPLMDLIADAYNSFLLPLYRGQSDSTWYSTMFPSSARGDDLTIAETLSELTGGKQLLTQNEARDRLGLDAKPGGDQINTANGNGALPPMLPSPNEEDRTNGNGVPRLLRAGDEDDVPALPTEAGTNLFDLLPEDHALATPEGRADHWRQLDELRRPIEVRFRKELSKVFRAWRAEFVTLVEQEGPSVLETRQAALDLEEWKRRFKSAYGPAALEAIIDAAERTFGSLEVALSIAPDDFNVEQFIDRGGDAFAGFVVATQIDIMRASLSDSAADELSAEEAAAAIHGTFPTANESRTRTMATTVVGAAIGFGVFESSKRAKAEKEKRVGLMWLSQRDDAVRDTHSAADGQMVEVGEAFFVGSCLMRFPLDSELCGDPAEIINCRCQPIPVAL